MSALTDLEVLEKAYEQLVAGKIDSFFYRAERGVMFRDTAVGYYGMTVHLLPGSFNPLHAGHRNIMTSAQDRFYAPMKAQLFAYELSIRRREKDVLDFEELKKRLSYFEKGELVAVTNADFFARKAGCFPKHAKLIFHIGYDTATRLIRDDETVGVQGIHAKFVVYPREVCTFRDIENPPRNMTEGKLLTDEYLFLSSTQIRQAQMKEAMERSYQSGICPNL